MWVGTLVVVESPAAVAIGIDVVNMVIADGGAVGDAEGVDATHVAQHALADVVDVIELDGVVVGERILVPPPPADGDAGVKEVGDFVVRDLVEGALADPDAVRAGEDSPAVMDDAIVDDVVAGIKSDFPGRLLCFADAHATGAEIMQMAVHDAAVVATGAEPYSVRAGVSDLAVLEIHMARAVGHDDGGNGDFGLRIGMALRWENVLAVFEREAFESQILNRLILVEISLYLDELIDNRCDDLGGVHVLAGERLVIECAVGIEKPFAGCVQGGFKILELIARRAPLKEGPDAVAGEIDGVGLRIDGGEVMAG